MHPIPDHPTPSDNTPDQAITKNIFYPCPYILTTKCTKNTGIGDCSIIAGWTTNYQNTKKLDFVDLTLKAGILFPTSQQKNSCPLSIPYGYNKRWGIPFSVDLAIGCYEWLTVGSHVEILPILTKYNAISYKRFGIYTKADHIMHGLSIWLGYTYSNKHSCNDISCHISEKVDPKIRPTTEPWSMHTIHFALEYDFTDYHYFFGPRVGFFIDTPVAGRNVFKTTMSGVFLGLEIAL